MCECQGNPLARVTLALGLPYLLVNRSLERGEMVFEDKTTWLLRRDGHYGMVIN